MNMYDFNDYQFEMLYKVSNDTELSLQEKALYYKLYKHYSEEYDYYSNGVIEDLDWASLSNEIGGDRLLQCFIKLMNRGYIGMRLAGLQLLVHQDVVDMCKEEAEEKSKNKKKLRYAEDFF